MIDVFIKIYHSKMVFASYPESTNSCKFSCMNILFSSNLKNHTFSLFIKVVDSVPKLLRIKTSFLLNFYYIKNFHI